MVEAYNTQDLEVTLGFLEAPKNSLVLTPKFLPSKVGGKPVSVNLEKIKLSCRLG
jgi:hypothetical protein